MTAKNLAQRKIRRARRFFGDVRVNDWKIYISGSKAALEKGYKAASTEYIKEFTKEIVWHRRIRAAVTGACGVLIVFFAIVLVCGLNNSDTLFTAEQSHALTALIVGCITGCVIVTIALVKGAFSNLADRNAGLPMPDHIKEIVDAAKNIVGGPGGN
ncbi:MAG: hypothetical protein M0R03_10775 [Novosphingobium sp.]|nr:hypothetical protein [Novosphingobium sp.]